MGNSGGDGGMDGLGIEARASGLRGDPREFGNMIREGEGVKLHTRRGIHDRENCDGDWGRKERLNSGGRCRAGFHDREVELEEEGGGDGGGGS